MLSQQLEHIIHRLEDFTPEEQKLIADQIQELLEDAEDVATARAVLNDPNEEWIPWEQVKQEMKADGLL